MMGDGVSAGGGGEEEPQNKGAFRKRDVIFGAVASIGAMGAAVGGAVGGVVGGVVSGVKGSSSNPGQSSAITSQ